MKKILNFVLKSSGFRFFFKGLNEIKEELCISVILVSCLTFCSSSLLYYVESKAQPDLYTNFWECLRWSFTTFLDDPLEHIEVHDPITAIGKIMWACIGLLKIAILAVPAGLVASGFSEAAAKDRDEHKHQKNGDIIRKTFNREMQSASNYYQEDSEKKRKMYKYVPRYRTLNSLQVKTGLNANDIVDAVNYTPDLRLVNLSATVKSDKHIDILAVAHMPVNTEYGCFINRGSNVTIISTSKIVGPSSFAFSLAAMGCFNFVSKELSPSEVDDLDFYKLNDDELQDGPTKKAVLSQAGHFLHDLNVLKKNSNERGEKHWFFVILGTLKSEKTVHFWRFAMDKDKKIKTRNIVNDSEYASTVLGDDENLYQKIIGEISSSLNGQNVKSDEYGLWSRVGDKNLMMRLGGGVDCNTVTIRISYDILVYDNTHLLKAKGMADAIQNNIEKDRAKDEKIAKAAEVCYMEKGPGYADKYGEKDTFFETNPRKLVSSIKYMSKDALKKYRL